MSENKKPVELIITRFADVYIVKSIKNSTYYVPGDRMTREVVQKCCEVPDWTVTIVDNEILQTILGHIAPSSIIP